MYDFKTIEEEILEFWKKNKIFEKLRKKNKGKKKFYFLDGPPYTSGKIHMGTAWNQVLKDMALRYKRMRGFDVWDRGGYDMHGLPTENAVQKKLNIKDKKEIEKFGVEKFVKKCKEFSLEMMEQMNKDFDRLAVSLDHENPYMPIKNDFMEGEWWLIKKAHEKNRLYRGKKVMTWCSKCETTLAKHELEYENVTDESIFVKFKTEGKKNEYLIVWTTTPWTIAYNLGVMVNPELDYVKAKVGNEIWILAKGLAGLIIQNFTDFKLEILEEFKGKKLEGLSYIHPFQNFLNHKYEELKKESDKVFTVVMSKEYVNLTAGTGLVHMAPGCGPEDYEVGRAYGIPSFNNITEKGDYPEDMGEFSGLNTKRDNKKFIEALEKRKALIATTKIEHDYAHCWRCKSPVIFRTTNQWFFKIEDMIPKMLKQSEKIVYIPEETKNRYQLWIKNLKDNSITRQRYWGTPMPVWECNKCDNYIVIGSVKELKELGGEAPEDLHIPWIDKIKIKCKCGGQMKRVPDIIDVWVDSGTASWNCLYYPKKKEYFEKYWPADLVLEATEQTRLWFYMLQLCSNLAMGKNCFKAMYTHGMIQDFQGVKMSKSLGNIISPEEVLNKYGVDAMRLYTTTNRAGENLNFSWEEIKLKYKELDVLLNVTNYLTSYSKKIPKVPSGLKVEDKWILSRLNSTIEECTKLLDNYQLDKAPSLIEQLFLDLSRKYIQFTRNREDNSVVFKIVFEVLVNVLKMLSVTCPYISETLYLKLREKYNLKEESVHLLSWPKPSAKKINKKLEQSMEVVLKIIEAGLAERDKVKIGLKWPLAKAAVHYSQKLEKNFEDLIKSQLNVKRIEWKKSAEKDLKVELNIVLTPELEAEGYAREMSRQIQEFRKKLGLQKRDRVHTVIITDEEFKKILEKQKNFIKERTNSKKLEIVTTAKERFKNKTDFKVIDKRGEITIMTTD
ncbi:MAG: isoleucine--tRNA ligase [Nanoarchaeota archaeon]|nr:isoleucine--tRNA ligase [Nanoarchaeota archaeon]